MRKRKSRKPADTIRAQARLQKLDWQRRGDKAEKMFSESYPTLRWNFTLGRYVAVGVPDGITDSFVYEFKSTKRPDYIEKVYQRAALQADLYCYFFGRSQKRIQILSIPNEKLESWDEEADPQNAKKVLECFSRIDGGWLPPLPEKYKCRTCEFKAECPILKH